MKTVVLVTFAIFILTNSYQAQTKPKFSDYPVRSVFKGKPARVDLKSAAGASFYRTNLRKGARTGPNFAGHYTLIEWGCGSPCLSYGMVDAKTGHVIWPPFGGLLIFVVSFRLDSRLVIVNSSEVLDAESPNGPPKWVGEWPEELFFRWNGKRFVEIEPHYPRAPRGVFLSTLSGRRT